MLKEKDNLSYVLFKKDLKDMIIKDYQNVTNAVKA